MNDHYIKQVVRGKTFLDVGPLWLTIFEKVSVAHKAGAKEVTALDQWDANDPIWDSFRNRMKELNVPNYKCIVADIDWFDYKYDVIYCAGVLYHNPDPLGLLRKLYHLSHEYVIISTTFIENYIKNSKGELAVPCGSSILLAGADEYELEVLREDWRQFLGNNCAIGLNPRPDKWDIENKHFWWYMFTKQAVISMCEIAGFEIEDITYYPKVMTLLLKKPEPSTKINKIFG